MKKNIIKLIELFLILSPLFDMLTACMLQLLNINFTIGMIVRFIIILICVFYLVFIYKGKDKKYLLLILGSIFIYLFIFLILIIVNKDVSVLLYEGQNALKAFYLPILLLSFYAIIKENKTFISNKTIVVVYIIYLLGIFIPDILGIGFDSYAVSKEGSIGFFNTANEISAIISILMPFFLLYLYNKKNFFLTIILVGVLVFDILSIGTKGPLLSFVLILGVILLIYIIYLAKERLYKVLSILVATLFLFILFISFYLPRTAFYKNIEIHLDFLGVDNVMEVFTDYELFDHFIFSSRLEFLGNTFNSYKDSSTLEKIFGIGYIENYGTDDVSTKMIEMDYFDILFRHGVVGFIIYMGVFIYFLYKAFKHTYRLKDNSYKICNYLSLSLIILLSLITGHVLLAPSVSIFVALILTKKEVV
ncbi:MAG TPA: O-antigen ligase family protein [Candidatus Onthousia faecipullorum]|uniref:O-antigen ligase family protein n=1 Tax=Candidatus Onthousia faecipullorum TaxID=2840887 RepID=A0A9D1GC40_9FIRM|nr:O-antigen ligase family protein [Candidatus Onthousia faecipullorum]